MPTLIRFVVFLAVLAGLAFAGMLALTLFVDPGEKEITVPIPAREMQGGAQTLNGPINVPRPLVNSIPEPANTTTPVPSSVTTAPPAGTSTAPDDAAPIAPGADQDVPE